jgi:S-phase kinase-associated protein 1
MLETVANLGADDSEKVPLADVKSETLAKILEYCTFHVTPEEPPADYKAKTPEEKKAFDLTYIDVTDDVLFDLIRGANYLDIKELLQLAADKVARRIVAEFKDPAAVKAAFNIVDDFSPEEHEELRKKETWIKKHEDALKG